MQTAHALASVALFDLLVIASNRGATCHVAEDQEQDVEGGIDHHGADQGDDHRRPDRVAQVPASREEGDETSGKEKECCVCHGSIPHDVGVDQQHADDQHEASGNGGGGGKFNEGHDSLLGTREHANEAVYSQAASDEAQDEDEEGHGSVLEKQVANGPQEAGECDATHKAQGEEGGGWHGLDLRLLLGAQALELTAARPRKHDQFLTERESGLFGCPLQKIADGYLAAIADFRDLRLAKPAFLNARDEL